MEGLCDILFYDLGSSHYKNPNHVGRDGHVFRNDLEFAIPRLARMANVPPRNGSTERRLVVYQTILPQHFPSETGEFRKNLKGTCHPTQFTRVLDQQIRCTLSRLQQIGKGELDGKQLAALCPPGEEKHYALQLPSKDDSDFIFEIPVNPPLSSEGRAEMEIEGAKHWEEAWVKDFTSHKNTTLHGLGTLYYLPTDLVYGARGDAHVSARDCTHYCWNPLLWEALWRVVSVFLNEVKRRKRSSES